MKIDLRSYYVITTWIKPKIKSTRDTYTHTLPIACNTDETVATSVHWNQFTDMHLTIEKSIEFQFNLGTANIWEREIVIDE
jgi:hypothetical protein